MTELAELGTEQTKKTLMRHGIPEPIFGVRIGDSKKYIVKRVKQGQQLALDLFATGNYDAQYLAGLSINPQLMSKADIQNWALTAQSPAIGESIVAAITAESVYAHELATEWLAQDSLQLKNTGLSSYSKYVSLTADADLSLEEITNLLTDVFSTIHSADNGLRYTLNSFIIAVGTYYLPLRTKSLEIAKEVGTVTVYQENICCQVPSAVEKIEKLISLNAPIKKKRRAIC